MATTILMKLLLLAALVAMTAASLDKISSTDALKSRVKSPGNNDLQVARAVSTSQAGDRKLLSTNMGTAQRKATKASANEDTTSVSAAELNAKVLDQNNDRKLMSIASVVSSDPQAAHKKSAAKYTTIASAGNRKLMAVLTEVATEARKKSTNGPAENLP